MKINFNGEESIRAPLSDVVAFLSDPGKVTACIPDSSDFSLESSSDFSIKVTVGVGSIHGVFAIKGSISKNSDGSFTYMLNGAGFGNKVSIKLTASPSEYDGFTKMPWRADFDLSGIISGLGEGIIRKVSSEKIAIIIKNVKEALEKAK
ncbi:MAG: SRPBCC domain-containing protein [Candidatus Micrarchaeaceae archaeon]